MKVAKGNEENKYNWEGELLKPITENGKSKNLKENKGHKSIKVEQGATPFKEDNEHKAEIGSEGQRLNIGDEGNRLKKASDGHIPVINGNHGNEELEGTERKGQINEKATIDATKSHTMMSPKSHARPNLQLEDEFLHHGNDLKQNLPRRNRRFLRTTWLTATRLAVTASNTAPKPETSPTWAG
ncbi:hypothetical protein TWF788_001951 [Orbilia oligospora]|uniref:Uncharacterized protein n=1 Tax=Orbilia oligospora TaxID=2813651 RepID=A0A7C8PLX1_ORBOL|nr:hypothetical protein TWF788_001951 [Orbilia oligospora]